MESKQIFIDFLQDYAEFFTELENAGQQKLEALLSYNLIEIENTIKIDESNAMRLQNLEKQRIQLQLNAGYSRATFKEIVTHSSSPEKAIFQEIFNIIEKRLQNIQFLNDKSLKFTRDSLDEIERATMQLELEKQERANGEQPKNLGTRA